MWALPESFAPMPSQHGSPPHPPAPAARDTDRENGGRDLSASQKLALNTFFAFAGCCAARFSWCFGKPTALAMSALRQVGSQLLRAGARSAGRTQGSSTVASQTRTFASGEMERGPGPGLCCSWLGTGPARHCSAPSPPACWPPPCRPWPRRGCDVRGPYAAQGVQVARGPGQGHGRRHVVSAVGAQGQRAGAGCDARRHLLNSLHKHARSSQVLGVLPVLQRL